MPALMTYSAFPTIMSLGAITSLFLLSGCTPSPNELNFGEVNIEVWQHGKKVSQVNNTYELQKNTFDLRFEFSKKLNLMISADYRGDLYDQIKRGIPFMELQGFNHSTGMADYPRNEGLSIFLSDQFPNIWFYDNAEKNRCNKIIETPNRLTCVRTISNIFYQENRETIPIEDYPHSFIYTSVFPFDYEQKTRKFTQLGEESFRLSFRY
jgi:hypothetical protein